MKELIKKLSELHGVSGREEGVRRVIEEETRRYADEVKTDTLGNLIVLKRGKGKKVMLAAHMDEVGLMVKYIDEKGYVRFAKIGGLKPSVILGQRVVFENARPGIIGIEQRAVGREGDINDRENVYRYWSKGQEGSKPVCKYR